jgi:hypothetical protein
VYRRGCCTHADIQLIFLIIILFFPTHTFALENLVWLLQLRIGDGQTHGLLGDGFGFLGLEWSDNERRLFHKKQKQAKTREIITHTMRADPADANEFWIQFSSTRTRAPAFHTKLA